MREYYDKDGEGEGEGEELPTKKKKGCNLDCEQWDNGTMGIYNGTFGWN